MDYSLIYFDYDVIRQRYGAEKASLMLREAVYLYHPDFLFYFHYLDWIRHEVWMEISNELPTKTIVMLADDHWRYKETEPVWRLFNTVLTTDYAGFRKREKEGLTNVFLTQWGCNHLLYRDLNLPRIYDVTFVGRCYGERKSFVQGIQKKGVKIAAFGQGWGSRGRISQADLIRIHNESKISLNISLASTGNKTQIKGRDFEAVACGSLLLTKDTEEIGRYFIPGEEIVTYQDLNDASEKIEYYLKNEQKRKEIARKGYERFMKDHTMERRLSEILSFAQKKQKHHLG
jgi:spore maturation protein CgeB